MDTFYQTFRWYVISCLFVCGCFFVFMADFTGGVKPLMPALLCFGFGYIASYFWHRYERRVQLISLSVFIAMSALAYYSPLVVYVALGVEFDLNFYLVWAGLNLFPAAPFMFFVFKSF